MESLSAVYEGWEGFNRSLVHAVVDLNSDTLEFRSHPEMNSVGEVFLHLADGRVDWLERIDPEGFSGLRSKISARESSITNAVELSSWLDETWQATAAMLSRWSVHDLDATYEQPYQGKVYAVSRQWVIWRIMCHDIYHGGQISELLAAQGIFPTELTLLGGHLTEPPVIR